MTRNYLIFVTLLWSALAGSHAVAGELFVANPSFEQDVTPFYTGLTPTGWNYIDGGSGGVFRPLSAYNGGNGNYMNPAQFPGQGAPDGVQVAYVVGGALSQITTSPAIVGTTYTLDVWAGTQNNIGGSGSSFAIGLYENNVQFATFSGTAPVNVYAPYSISGIAPGTGNVEIRLTGNGQTLFDDVRLFATPEPGSFVLAALGAATLACCGWGKRRMLGKG